MAPPSSMAAIFDDEALTLAGLSDSDGLLRVVRPRSSVAEPSEVARVAAVTPSTTRSTRRPGKKPPLPPPARPAAGAGSAFRSSSVATTRPVSATATVPTCWIRPSPSVIMTIESWFVSSASSDWTTSPNLSGRHWPLAIRMKALPQMLTTVPRGEMKSLNMDRLSRMCNARGKDSGGTGLSACPAGAHRDRHHRMQRFVTPAAGPRPAGRFPCLRCIGRGGPNLRALTAAVARPDQRSRSA